MIIKEKNKQWNAELKEDRQKIFIIIVSQHLDYL
jgi:hypothetical protein